MAVVTPVLRKMRAFGADVTSPRRIILVYQPNGPMIVTGPASGSETDFKLHDWWSPLERHKADGIFFSHMSATGAGVVPGSAHHLGGQVFAGFGSDQPDTTYAGQTIDQVISKRLEAQNRGGLRRSLAWGLLGNDSGPAFIADKDRSITVEEDPAAAWADLFSGFSAPPPTDAAKARAAQLLARDQGVMNFVSGNCLALTDALGVEGMRLLDDHCTTVTKMGQNLSAGMTPAVGMCSKPASPSKLNWEDPNNIDTQLTSFFDLAAATLACELSHVIGFQFGGIAARNRIASKYNVPSSSVVDTSDSGPAHHPWTHNSNSADKTKALQIFQTFYSTQIALLLDRLKGTNDAYGKPLLDSTMVVVASELGGNEKNTDPHQNSCVPAMVFGNGQGTFKTGRYIHGKSPDTGSEPTDSGYKEGGRDMAHLLISAIQYMGFTDVTKVGGSDATGPLAALAG
ncbi:MAG TPA: DUF1552 domain-containing protein [Polyangia bacterium]|nr:DUF1552 domain-containing protein [Polyangia bacterium]